MLSELRIQNFAIIRELELSFDPGLIVLTGETGAGKSIIMGALDMLLGQRVDMEALRSGSDFASVEAVFTIPDDIRDEIREILVAEELWEEQGEVSLTRELRKDKRNVARVNGYRTNVSLLVRLGELLVDIHGQSEHLSLMRVNQHLGLLDRYADLSKEAARYQQVYDRWTAVRDEIRRLEAMAREADQRRELLAYQIDEIQSAQLVPGEEEELREHRNRLANSEKLAELSQEILILMEEAPPDQPTVNDLFGQVVDAVTRLTATDSSLGELESQAEEIHQGISEINHQLRIYLDQLEYQPDELEQAEERLAVIKDLQRKYGDSIPEVLDYAREAAQELEEITGRSERIEELQKKRGQLLDQLAELGQDLTQKRKAAAEKLTEHLESELDDLKMESAKFRVNFTQKIDPDGLAVQEGRRLRFTRRGLETVEFLIETNPGEGLKPLAKVASGGETARLMLAIKSVLAKADRIPSLVFDEIDQGIGGRIGAVVGGKLSRLADNHQVFCITHLPQLACFGEQHLQVQKSVQENRTRIQVREISGKARVEELAHMLGGLTDHNLQAAQELLSGAEKYS
jgi:DNA repair protein RecN (Recombination protein N)